MSEDAELRSIFLDAYTEYVERVLAPTRAELKKEFEKWRQPGYWRDIEDSTDPAGERHPTPSPVQRIHTRIKRVESVVDKIRRKPDSFPAGLTPISFRQMPDIIGVRVVIYFLSHIPLIHRKLQQSDIFEVCGGKDAPVAYLSSNLAKRLALLDIKNEEKESGYASIHYVLRLKNSSVPPEDRPWFELQLRTLTEDIWGEIEHVLGYKPNKRTSFAVRRQFQIISKLLGAIDEHFNFIYEELSRFQGEGEISPADLLNAENLPPELTALGLGCAQKEIDGMLKLLASRKIMAVGDLRHLVRQKHLEIVRSTYSIQKGRPPNNFEMVANLANLVGCNDEVEQVERIKGWIALQDAWDDLKGRGLA